MLELTLCLLILQSPRSCEQRASIANVWRDEDNLASRVADLTGSRGQNSGLRRTADRQPFVGIAPARTTNHRRMFIVGGLLPRSTIVKYPLTRRPKHVSLDGRPTFCLLGAAADDEHCHPG